MSLSTQFSAQDFLGNNTTSTYPAGFPVQSADDVWVAVKLAGETEFTTLDRSAFTVLGLDAEGFTVETHTVYSPADTVKVFRLVNYDQLFSFSEGGPLPVGEIGRALDRIVMQVQRVRLEAGLEGATITLPAAAAAPVKGVAIFTAATRTSTIPEYIGQPGVETDTGRGYYATSISPVVWTRTKVDSAVRLANTSLSVHTPDFLGQLATYAGGSSYGDGFSPMGLYKAYGTGTGNWVELTPTMTFCAWECLPWAGDEALQAGQTRWLGASGLRRFVDSVLLAVNQPGAGELTIKLWVRSLTNTGTLRRELGSASYTFSNGASFHGACPECLVSVNPEFRLGGTGIDSKDCLEVEVITAGAAVTTTTTAGDGVSHPSTPASVSTGTTIHSPTHGDQYVVFVKGNGDVITSRPATTSGTGPMVTGNRLFVRGVKGLTLTAGDTVVPADVPTLSIIRIGDSVSGPTVPPGAVVTAIDTVGGDFTISLPVNGDTSLVTVTNPTRPPVHHFIEITGVDESTTITLPTTGIKTGDNVIGVNVPAGTYVTAVGSTTITLSAELTGDIGEVTVSQPVRTASIDSGTREATVDAATGIRIGLKVTGPGISEDTFVQEVDGTEVTLDRPVSQTLADESLQFTRDTIRITGELEAGSPMVQLSYAVNTTEVTAGYFVFHPALPPGTKVSSVAGSAVTLSHAAREDVSIASLLMALEPPWKGLSVSVCGYAQPYPTV